MQFNNQVGSKLCNFKMLKIAQLWLQGAFKDVIKTLSFYSTKLQISTVKLNIIIQKQSSAFEYLRISIK